MTEHVALRVSDEREGGREGMRARERERERERDLTKTSVCAPF